MKTLQTLLGHTHNWVAFDVATRRKNHCVAILSYIDNRGRRCYAERSYTGPREDLTKHKGGKSKAQPGQVRYRVIVTPKMSFEG